ncbi:hypothetical protein CMUS01_08231 [Colletotrichum musicola]|uniref:F-box domain-containing protein n=1 Tax=Colletotrichum musicola TaxID=2175873 RepID=A0A8H6KDD9_9PEZI|nr:hypothetical protein CMUS01_08231 [Colletotrichum musicola]
MISLLDLPITVVEDILESLCHHCRPPPTECRPDCDCPTSRQAAIASRAALASLCRTSKTLKSMATPLLYHQPTCFDQNKEAIPLAQSLLSRPDLAQHVRVLKHTDAWALYEPEPQEAVDFFKELAAEEADDVPEEWLDKGRLLDLVASVCPNLEELSVQTYYDSAEYGLFSAPGSLPCLRKLSQAHGDTELTCDMGLLEPLFDAAPKLASLKGVNVGGFGDGLRLKRLTKLELERSEVTERNLSAFLERLPRLEEFSYSAGGATVSDSEGMLPRGFQTALTLHAPRLRRLAIDLEMAFLGRDLTEETMLRSLKGLEQLEELKIDTRCLAVHENPGASRAMRMPDGTFQRIPFVVPEPDPMVLVNLLPASIRSFRLRNRPGYGGPKMALFVPAIVRLGEVAAEMFPHLKAVAFPGLLPESAGEARSAFEAAGISFTL